MRALSVGDRVRVSPSMSPSSMRGKLGTVTQVKLPGDQPDGFGVVVKLDEPPTPEAPFWVFRPSELEPAP